MKHEKEYPILTTQTFETLGLAEPITRALADAGYTEPTPIQTGAIPAQLGGRDVLGLAQTGTGKTAAFGLPILHRLLAEKGRPAPRTARALILAPTRELAVQIEQSLKGYAKHMYLSTALVLGGLSRSQQIRALSRGVDILIATPGRLTDLMAEGRVKLHATHFLVLDEADRMLDMGFIRDVRRIVSTLPKARQSLLFSATMPKPVEALAAEMLHNPVRVEIAAKTVAVDRIDQSVAMVPTPASGPIWPACCPTRPWHGSWSSPVPSTAPIRSPAIWKRTASRPRRSTATSPRTPASARSTSSSPDAPGSWSPPTSPPAASMSTASPM